jgi:hypothetical protein
VSYLSKVQGVKAHEYVLAWKQRNSKCEVQVSLCRLAGKLVANK